MIKSMTGYGRAETSSGDMKFVVEAKSVNSRFLEAVARLPKKLQPLESKIKSIVSSRLKRGRVELFVNMTGSVDNVLSLELNKPLAKTYYTVFQELNNEFGSRQPVELSFLYNIKDMFITKQDSFDFEKIWPDLSGVVEKVLSELETMRINEGNAIEKEFSERIAKIEIYLDEIKAGMKESVEGYRDKLIQKITRLIASVEINEDRLMQEVAFMADRSDITEELTRIDSHIDQFRNYMAIGEPVGRRLDFLLQEMNREVNTIGSKASDSSISQITVEVKAELEKLKEQVQNIE